MRKNQMVKSLTASMIPPLKSIQTEERDTILKDIVNRSNKIERFSIIADETTDIAGIQQLSSAVRFINLLETAVFFDSARGRVRPRAFSFLAWITMDMSASRTDVASSIEVSDLFTLEPMSFDVMAATEYIENCTTCAMSEDLCVQWAALKCSRRSIRLQNAEFKKYIREVELSRRTPTAASPASQQKRPLAKRQPASPQKDVPSKKQAKSERKLPRTSTSPRHIEDSSSMEEGETSAEESSVEIESAKPAKSVIAQSSPAATQPPIQRKSRENQSTFQSFLPADTNFSDIQNIIDLFKIISNILKQCPKLINILPALKATKDFKQQAFLILQALMD
ncbi:hypothetical protein TNCV_3179131 [Trichonephila clavipes]|nr:hypothetical protein TNCV_3179131 [Trichonephila clavipes]